MIIVLPSSISTFGYVCAINSVGPETHDNDHEMRITGSSSRSSDDVTAQNSRRSSSFYSDQDSMELKKMQQDIAGNSSNANGHDTSNVRARGFDMETSLRDMEYLPTLDRDRQEYVNVHRKQDLTTKRKQRIANRERVRRKRELSSIEGGEVSIKVLGRSSSRSSVGMYVYICMCLRMYM